MNQEIIFVQTDPSFNVVLQSLRELRDQNRLQVVHFQTACLTDIESNNDDEDKKLMFGGQVAGSANSAFGRTASAVLRMCMLTATGIPPPWPSVGPNTGKRNEEKIHQEVVHEPVFHLANEENAARLYWSKYDQIYPHFRIQHEISQVPVNNQVGMPSMMLIFRGNFTEVVEITTTFTATPREDQRFNSYIHVTCIVRRITAESQSPEHPDGEYTKLLKELMEKVKPIQIGDAYLKKMTEIKEGDELEDLLKDLLKDLLQVNREDKTE